MTIIVALNIYGAVLATDIDPSYPSPPRIGLVELLDKCEAAGIDVVTVSNNNIPSLRDDLEKAFDHFAVKRQNLHLGRFEDFYIMREDPKEFHVILDDYGLSKHPKELFVIGNSYEKDIIGAVQVGARYFKVPEFVSTSDGYDYDLSQIPIPGIDIQK